MARPGYLSLYVDSTTQQIFHEFTRIKGIPKADALADMMELYMLCTDEALFHRLQNQALGVEAARPILRERQDETTLNDYLFIKLGEQTVLNGPPLDGRETMAAYLRCQAENGLGYVWFGTQSLHHGMAQKKIRFYNDHIAAGRRVQMLFNPGGEDNEIRYVGDVLEVVSGKDPMVCPGDAGGVPAEIGAGMKYRIWVRLTGLREQDELTSDMFRCRNQNDYSLKYLVSETRYHFGYVYLPETEKEED